MLFFSSLSKFLILFVPALICVAFLTLLERKVLSLTGTRVGPNKVSLGGVLQPIVDAIKLSNKQINFLSNFSWFFYYLSSILMIFCSGLLFSCLLLSPSPVEFKFSILIFFLVIGVNSFNSIISGWSTFSKFSLIGSIRTVTQLISYEASLYLVLFFIVVVFFTFDLNFLSCYKLDYFMFLVPICFLIWIPTFLAELNRTPYDFSEGESELVSGFNTEFGCVSFTLIFLAEYANILFFCILSGLIFFFNLYSIFMFLIFVIWIRSVLPRFRFDKLMYLCWKFYIPFLTLFLMFFCGSFF